MGGLTVRNASLGQIRQNSRGLLGALAGGASEVLGSADSRELVGLPRASASVVGASLVAADLDGNAAWSPSAAALLPDILPVAGTLLSYGGANQLAAGGTVSHAGAMSIGGVVQIGTNGPRLVPNVGGAGRFQVTRGNGIADFYVGEGGSGGTVGRFFGISNNPGAGAADVCWYRGSTGPTFDSCAAGGFRSRNLDNNSDAPIACSVITASGVASVSQNSSSPTLTLSNTTSGAALRLTDGTYSVILRPFLSAAGDALLIRTAANDGLANLSANNGTFATIRSIGAATIEGAINANGNPITCGAITAASIGVNATTAKISFPSTAQISYDTASGGGSATHFFRENGTSYLQVAGGNGEIQGTRAYTFGMTTAAAPSLALYLADANTLELNNRTPGTFRDFKARAITASGALQETPRQSSITPSILDIPTGKRQGWYNTTLSEFRDYVNMGGTLLKSAAYT
jgi:hypothetical protein